MAKKQRNADKLPSIGEARGRNAKGVGAPRSGNDPGSAPIRRQPARKAEKTYPLRLTGQQRESLIHCTRLKRKIKERLGEAGDGTQVVGVTRKELDHLNDELGQAALYAPSPHKQRLVAVLHRAADLLAKAHAGRHGQEEPKVHRTAPRTGDMIYQFKVALLDIKPAIWRRIQVPDGTLADLHEYIQAAFGWWNYHLHQFEIDGERYGPVAPDGMDFGLEMRDEIEVTLGQLVPKSGRKPRWVYLYDFGDGWRHEVVFEGFLPREPRAKYPVCVGGERACPPEDCGGPWGYVNYLAAIADPDNEQHEELLGWRGPFDPEAFEPEEASREMRKIG